MMEKNLKTVYIHKYNWTTCCTPKTNTRLQIGFNKERIDKVLLFFKLKENHKQILQASKFHVEGLEKVYYCL